MDRYTVQLTPRMRDSLKSESLQKWLVAAEGSDHPYWTHVMADIIEQISSQGNVTPLHEYEEGKGQKIWLS